MKRVPTIRQVAYKRMDARIDSINNTKRNSAAHGHAHADRASQVGLFEEVLGVPVERPSTSSNGSTAGLTKAPKPEENMVSVIQAIGLTLTTSLSLVAGMAWNDAAKEFFNTYIKSEKQNLQVKFVYALVITIAIGLLVWGMLNVFDVI